MSRQSAAPTPLWQRLLLIVVGIVFAFLLVTLVLAAFPGLVRNQTPGQRQDANTTIPVQFHVSDGDMFTTIPGKVRPPADDPALAAFTISWDADSFRIPARQADHYPIAAFGDSYTEGANVAAPWPDRLAEDLNIPVQNYGYRGYGPLEEAQAVHDFAGKDQRTWILYQFYAGNDLGDANRSSAQTARTPFTFLPFLAQQAAGQVATRVAADSSTHYDYPMPVIIGGNYYDMAFLDYYLWRQVAPPEGFAASKTFQIVSDALDEMEKDTPNTCRAVIFAPTKEQLYYQYIHPGVRQFLRDNAYRTYIDKNGYLQIEPSPITEAEEPDIIQHFNDQRDAMKILVESKPGWYFIDLLPVFKQHVDAGELLYYPYDTHWNQVGHDLAAQTIADAMKAVPGCSTGG